TVEGLIKSIGDDDRIHTTYSQTIAATGRLSSTEPNLQNVPIRTDEGRTIRDTFIVGAGYSELMTADYSQIEMRIMAHLSADTAPISGRRRYLPDLASDNRQRREMAERMALNAPIQGSAADIIKVAMLGVHRGLTAAKLRSRMLLQVHDELVLEIADGERDAA